MTIAIMLFLILIAFVGVLVAFKKLEPFQNWNYSELDKEHLVAAKDPELDLSDDEREREIALLMALWDEKKALD